MKEGDRNRDAGRKGQGVPELEHREEDSRGYCPVHGQV